MEQLDNIIKLFLKKQGLEHDKNVLAVFAFGSKVSKTATINSDLDLQIIFENEMNKRGALKIENVTVEYYYNTIDSIINLEKLCYNNNSPLFFSALKNIYVYKNKDNTVEELKKTLDRTFNYNCFEPKNHLALKNQLIMLYNRILDLLTLKEKDDNEFYYLYYLTLERAKNYYCDALGHDKMKEGKYQNFFNNSPNYSLIRRVDSTFEILFKNCFITTNPDDNLQKLTKLFNYILEQSPIKLDFNNYTIDFNEQ